MPKSTSLLDYVVTELRARRGQWPHIAEQVDGVSYSFIQKLAMPSGYKSSPTYAKLEALATWLKAHPQRRATDKVSYASNT
jgi:hypothetical protein